MPDLSVAGFLAWLAVVAVTIAIPVAIIAVVVRLARRGREDPKKVLRERLSRGEITPAEYEAAMRAYGR